MLQGSALTQLLLPLGMLLVTFVFPKLVYANNYTGIWSRDFGPLNIFLVIAGLISLFLIRRSKTT